MDDLLVFLPSRIRLCRFPVPKLHSLATRFLQLGLQHTGLDMAFNKRDNQDLSLRCLRVLTRQSKYRKNHAFLPTPVGSSVKIFLQNQDYPRIFSEFKAFFLLHSAQHLIAFFSISANPKFACTGTN